MMMEDCIFPYSRLSEFTIRVLHHMGCGDEHARLAAEVLLAADLRGIDSHGIARLTGYVRLWEAGRINTSPDIRVVHQTPSTATVDGDGGLGLVVAPFAMQLALDKADAVGSGWVSVRNSNHFGIAGYHAMRALPRDMIGIAMTNASPLVAPTFSRERLLGTNPIAVAIPAGDEPPFVADFATTTASNGKLEILQRKSQSAPEGWIQDQEGKPSTDPFELMKGGALLPLGGDREHGSHKGYGLGAIVDILSAVLSGANYGPWAPPFVSFLSLPPDPVGSGLGHFFGALRIDGFGSETIFRKNMDLWIRRFRNAVPVEAGMRVRIPGDPERETEAERIISGIPLGPKVLDELKQLGEKFEISF
jgi:L-2-hydroxycarboxylate dehydrogenase (NAD+)